MKLQELGGCVAMLMLGGTAMAATTYRGEAGVVVSRGNAETDTANARIEWVNERDVWRNLAGVAGLYGSSSGSTNATRLSAHAQTDRKFFNRNFWFTALTYDDDRFSGFDYQATLSTGVGREFVNNDRTLFKGQVGAGYRSLRTELLTVDDNGFVTNREKGEESADIIASSALSLEHSLTESTKVLAALGVESGRDNTQSRGDLALQVKMTELLAISVGLNMRNNTNPPAGLEKTDTLTTLNLVYERK